MLNIATDLDIRRETEIIKLIKLFKGLDFIVVDGYAVDAYTIHRFSIDLDIVVRKQDLTKFEKLIIKGGYELKTEKKDFDLVYSGEFKQYIKNEVTVDFLVNSLVSRTTDASWGFDTILNNSSKRMINGLTKSIEAVVPTKEMLVAMKLHSGRTTDLRDITMLAIDLDNEKILSLVDRGKKESLKGIIEKYIDTLKSKNFVDSLKGVFSIGKKRKINLAEIQIKKTLKLLELLKDKSSKGL